MSAYAQLDIHIVFSTKHRELLIDGEWAPRLYSIIGGALRSTKCTLLSAGGIEDHVHLLVSLARDLSVSDAVRNIKTASGKWIHDEFQALAGFHWQDGYAAFSVSQSQLPVAKRYIANQKEHHKRKGFQDELRQLLRLHDVEFDERYLWD
jgi:putative transposase